MKSFPSSIKNDGAAFKQNYVINKNSEEDKHTYAPKYARIPKSRNNISQKSKQEIAQKNQNTLNLENNEKYEQTLSFNKRKTESKKITPYIKSNKGVTRRPNSAIGYRNSNYSIKEGGDEAAQNLIDFNIESFLETIEIENESTEENKNKTKNTKRKSRTRPNSPHDPSNLIASLPQQFVKLPERKKEKNKTNIIPRSADYSHLNGHELYQNEQNIEKFGTRLTKKSRKDAVLQRSILAKYTQNQVEYVGINKEKKKTIQSENSVKTNDQDNDSSQANESNDESNINIINDDSIDIKFNSDTSSSTNSSKNKQQQNQQENIDKSKQILFSKNDDKFSHLNFRMTTTINYNELAKAQSKYTKKIKDVNKSNNNITKTNDNQTDSKPTTVPPRLFFSRTPLFDDPENPKQRETQRIVTNKPFQNISKEKASSSRIYYNDSNLKKENNLLTPQNISKNMQNIGPTPQSKDINSKALPMLNAPQQRATTNISVLPPKLNLNTPHSKSYHNSARKSSRSSFIEINNKDNDKDNASYKKSNRPPMIPNSRSIPSNSRNDSPNSSCSLQPRNQMENLVPIPRPARARRQTAAHRSLIIGSEKDSLFLALAKLHNLSDSTSPPTPSSTNSTNNRHQNNQGIFKLNPILPNKKPKEEKTVEKENEEENEKTKPIDSITFQMTALEKFKKDKKRKQLEERGIYHYKKETIKVKNDQKENKNQTENQNENDAELKEEEEEKIEENDSDSTQKQIQSNDESPLSSNNISSDDFNDTEIELSQNEETEIDLEDLSQLTEK